MATNRFALANQAVVAADAEQDQQGDDAADDAREINGDPDKLTIDGL